MMSVNKKNTNLQKILDLLKARGVDKRKQSSTVADILGIKYNSAKQKLDGKRSLPITEVKKIYRYFNASFDGKRDYNCVFKMNDTHVRCNIEVDTEIANLIDTNENYAFKYNDNYLIDMKKIKGNERVYKVKKINFLPAPKVAILDNDVDILELLETVLTRFGFEIMTFQTKEEILEAMKKYTFDGFIIDWLLDYGQNSNQIIRTIRENNEIATLILLTGQLNQHEKEIGETILKYGIKMIEKPTRMVILSSILLNSLFFKE